MSDYGAEFVPIISLGKYLLVSIQIDLHDRMALNLQEELSNRIVKERAKGVIIDISALEMVDSFIGRVLGGISGIARLLDAQTVLVGMRPTVAMTLLELGITIAHMKTALNVEDAIDLLRKSMANRSRKMVANVGSRKLKPTEKAYVAVQAAGENEMTSKFGASQNSASGKSLLLKRKDGNHLSGISRNR